jgi:hypothetical protein
MQVIKNNQCKYVKHVINFFKLYTTIKKLRN